MSTRKIRELIEAYRKVEPAHKDGASGLSLEALAEIKAIEEAAKGHVRVMQHIPTDSNFDDLMESIAKDAP